MADMDDVAFELPDDHPGVSDPAYRARRAAIAAVGEAHRPGAPIPDVEYSAEEDAVWRTVSRELAAKHRRFACAAYLDAAERLQLPADRVPQLREVDERVAALTGFHIEPVPGLVPTATVLRRPRRPPVPLDAVHPPPLGAVLHAGAGHHPRDRRARQHARLTPARRPLPGRRTGVAASSQRGRPRVLLGVFWFTLEFGVAWEGDEVRAYGAGLLSSYGEIETFRDAERREWDLVAMGTKSYDITAYQPVLFVAPSVEWMVDELGTFFDGYDDEAHLRLTAATASR